jgi:hypothetical protein
MKYINIVLILFVTTLISCTKDSTGGVSTVTNYPIITLNGDDVVYVEQGSTYVDQGAVSTEGGVEIPTETIFSNGTYYNKPGVDTSAPDLYVVTYSAVNEDGFSGTALRNVWVYPPAGDLVTSIEGLYTANILRGTAPRNNLGYIFIVKTGANTYSLSHGIGGWYDYGSGYGPDYAARGAVITANNIPANDFTVTDAVFPIWGNIVVNSGFTVDPANKTISFTGTGNFGNGVFKVQLTQVQF